MTKIQTDELIHILSFLSINEKLNFRLACKEFYNLIKKFNFISYVIETKIKYFFSLENNISYNLSLVANNNFIIYTYYTRYQNNRIHPLFKKGFLQKNCLNSCCSGKRLEYIYIPIYKSNIPRYLKVNTYNKRYMPYCLNCFNEWSCQ